ncbi:MAG: hypothetical protein IPK30_09415 [Cellvibrionales bacterium]|nr:hypothetical protein [Cellvibrionales bacterium]
MKNLKQSFVVACIAFYVNHSLAQHKSEDAITEAAGSYLASVYALQAVKQTKCGYALLMNIEELSQKAEQDIESNISSAYKNQLPKYKSTAKAEMQSIVANNIRSLDGKIDPKTQCGLVVGMLLGNFTQYWTEFEKEVGKAAMKPDSQEAEAKIIEGFTNTANQYNQQLPMMIDQDTRLDKLTVGPGPRAVYHCTLPKYTSRDIDANWIQTKLRPDVTRKACASTDMKKTIQYGGIYVYAYSGNDGAEITRFEVGRNDCSFPTVDHNVQSDIKIGDCLTPNNGNTLEKIVQVVSVTPTEYKVFTSLLVNGKLIQAEDYQSLDANKASSSYSKIACPAFEGSFSPDAYINQKQ